MPFCHYIEDGTILFVGATTENPSFELNNALLSRTRTYVLKSNPGRGYRTGDSGAPCEDSEHGLGQLDLQYR